MNALRNADRYIPDINSVGSYFELYHYLMQRTIMDQIEFDRKKGIVAETDIINSNRYSELVRTHGTYCKDFVKALNIAFAYNLPRYKNLSIDELFDRNNYRPEVAE